jgi:cystathionine beta-lyase
MDFDDFENKIRENQIKLFLLCSPHNPVGRVWSKEELIRIGDICLKYGVIVVSDEIHNDFVYNREHYVFASLKKEYEDISIICTSPSKTFNLASMLISNIFIPNWNLKRKFRKQVDAAGISQLSALGLVACEAAYQDGEVWYQAMISYIKSNIDFVKDYVDRYLRNVKMIETEGTYLVWLDFREAGLDANILDRKIIYDAKVWLDSGRIFGDAGKGFQRINVACPRSIVKEALDRIRVHITDRIAE